MTGKIGFLTTDGESAAKSQVKLTSDEDSIIVDMHYDMSEKDGDNDLADVDVDEILFELELSDDSSSLPTTLLDEANDDDDDGRTTEIDRPFLISNCSMSQRK